MLVHIFIFRMFANGIRWSRISMFTLKRRTEINFFTVSFDQFSAFLSQCSCDLLQVLLYSDLDFQGSCRVCSQDQSCFPEGLPVGSVRVVGGRSVKVILGVHAQISDCGNSGLHLCWFQLGALWRREVHRKHVCFI